MSTEPDRIAQMFDQAVRDGRRDDVCEHWSSVAMLRVYLLDVRISVSDLVRFALDELQEHPRTADLTPREYERLLLVVERLRADIDEFGEAWEAVERNMARAKEG